VEKPTYVGLNKLCRTIECQQEYIRRTYAGCHLSIWVTSAFPWL